MENGKSMHHSVVTDNFVDFNDVSLESLGSHLLFGEISVESTKAAVNFILKANLLYPHSEELTLFVNSVGGNCYDGFALIDVMQNSHIPICTVGLGSIVSMGVLLLSAGTRGRRVMLRNTEVMAHQFSSSHDGKFHELMAAMKGSQRLQYQYIQHFKRHTKMTDKQIKTVIFSSSDVWLTPQECKSYGIIDAIIDELPSRNGGSRRVTRAPRRRARRPASEA